MAERKYNRWIDYTIDVHPNIVDKIKLFTPTEVNGSGNKSFKLSKNHILTNTFKKSEIKNINIQNNTHGNIINEFPKKAIKISINQGNNDSIIISSKKNDKQNQSQNQKKYDNKREDKDIIMKGNNNE